jgi:uncharacterized membrane protein
MKPLRYVGEKSAPFLMVVSIVVMIGVDYFARASALPTSTQLLLSLFVSLLIWVPSIFWMARQQWKKSEQERQAIEAKFAAQDAELLDQFNKHNG